MKAIAGFRIRFVSALALALAFLPGLSLAAAEGQALPKTLELDRAAGRALALLGSRCIECHDWAGSHQAILSGGRLVPGKPEESELYYLVDSGQMPLSGARLGAEELALLRDWILAGAPKPSAESLAAAKAGSPSRAEAPGGSFLGFPSKADYHRAAGWTSAGLLLAAGIVGGVHAYDLMSSGHEYRDSLGMTEEEEIGAVCSGEISGLWGSEARQGLRWTHVGLLVAGEGLYLGNALTGLSMSTAGLEREGVSRGDIHRWAFFAHAGLMATELVLGILTTEALRRGDHEALGSLGVAHAAVGLGIPILVIASGIEMDWGRGRAGAPDALGGASP